MFFLMRLSVRNQLSAKVCSQHVLWICQCVIFIWGLYLKGKVYKSNYCTLKCSVSEHSKRYGYCQITVLRKTYLNMLTNAHQVLICISCLLKATYAYSHWSYCSIKMIQLCKSHCFVVCNMTNVYTSFSPFRSANLTQYTLSVPLMYINSQNTAVYSGISYQ